ncbi:NAD(P)-dependent oxidoreductase [Acinetobacter chengduensis]|uniref:NAD(P)-dependent oxidoreductase n=2 Tax=Moraxellaceae TaxID=468 RepID=A0ABX9TX54_9GAMM|nr:MULTISPECIES: NAD(P)-dependent oxidoreductase [Acinetobacter]MBI1450658.1 NAD(P)-dependent oxidoreductase [Acinetobacter sp. FL51]RKG40746.1 NAD(P)-dependent oxidoreductase [Acinetobacter sp. WCHAc060007]RLL22147.1 NAD(P)-dependent oxidoreductase [Acinetobacter chengduensis]
MKQTVAFIGLGAMGWHMASHLPKTGLDVLVWNRTEAKAQQHASHFATQAVTIEQAVQADYIFSCLPTSADVEQLIQAHPPKAGSVWIDCTSGVPESAQKLSKQLQTIGVAYLDAPVSGQTIGAENGTLTVMVGGDALAFEQAKPVIQAFAGLIEHVGDSGSGFAVKAVNNTLMATHLWALAEGMTLLKSKGVDLASALSCINHSSGKSSMSENIMAQRVLNRGFNKTFALDLLQKDIGIAVDLIQQEQLQLPAMQMVQQQFTRIEKSKAQDLDFSAAVQSLEQMNRIELS